MRKRFEIIILTLCSIAFFILPVSAAVYTWKDKDGNTVVSSSPPPPGVNSEKVGQEKESMQTEEGKPKGKGQMPVLRSKGPIPPPTSREGVQAGQKQVNRNQRAYSDIKVLLYKTSWCPYCHKASEYLTSLGVNLTEYDVEQDSEKDEESRRKGGSGVPIIDVEGTILRGFSAAGIKEAVEKKRNGG